MAATKILIMGLPGAGKTYFAERLSKRLTQEGQTVLWLNADKVRTEHNDWDFSETGRIRQATRMRELAEKATTDYVIADFVAPLESMRSIFHADWVIWMDTITEGRYADTNKMFDPPVTYDFRITEQHAEKWVEFVLDHLLNNRRRPRWDNKKETVQMLGRWQPWHDGHRALFERLLQRTGQVLIMVRDVQGWQDSNPFNFFDVVRFIRRDLDPLYQGQYEIMLVPNIVHIGWGRGVGYTAGEEEFDSKITDISATKIRKQLGLK